MGRETERKFLVQGDLWKSAGGSSRRIRQGYLVAEQGRSVRVRLHDDGAALTVKGASHGATRAEFEYAIPEDDAREMLETLCVGTSIDKTRHRVEHGGHVWEVDVFHGANEGLVVAEIELESESEPFERPGWLGREVTDDPRYLNASLVHHPMPVPARSDPPAPEG